MLMVNECYTINIVVGDNALNTFCFIIGEDM